MWCQRPNSYKCTVPAHWETQQNHSCTFILLKGNRAALFHHHRNSIYHKNFCCSHRLFCKTGKYTYRILHHDSYRFSRHIHKHWKWKPVHHNRCSWSTSSCMQWNSTAWEAGRSYWNSSRTSVRQSECKEVSSSAFWPWFFGNRNLEG